MLAPIASFVLATNAVPTAGKLGTNNVAYASVTTLRPYEDGSINNILNTIVSGTIVVVSNAVTRFYYSVTAIADSGSYRSFTVTYLGYRGSSSAWTNGETIVLSIVQTSASVIALIDGAIGTAWKTDPATLTPDDLDDTSTANKFITAAELVKLAGIETAATADQLAVDVPTTGTFTNFTPGSANVQAALAAIDTKLGSSVIAPVDEIWINAGMIVPGTIAGATEGSYSTTIATYDVLYFNQTTEQDGFFTIVFGQKWNAGTIKVKFYWTAEAGSGACIWGIQAVSVSSATNLDQTFGTAREVTQTLSAIDQLLISSATAAITIGNTPAVDDLIQFRVYRKAAAGGDTLSGTASLIGIEIQYTQVQTGVAW